MPLPLIAALGAPAVGKVGGFLKNIFRKKPGGTAVGNAIRGIFKRKPTATATPPIYAPAPASPIRSATTTPAQRIVSSSGGGSSSGIGAWIKENTVLAIGIGVGIILLFGKKLFK